MPSSAQCFLAHHKPSELWQLRFGKMRSVQNKCNTRWVQPAGCICTGFQTNGGPSRRVGNPLLTAAAPAMSSPSAPLPTPLARPTLGQGVLQETRWPAKVLNIQTACVVRRAWACYCRAVCVCVHCKLPASACCVCVCVCVCVGSRRALLLLALVPARLWSSMSQQHGYKWPPPNWPRKRGAPHLAAGYCKPLLPQGSPHVTQLQMVGPRLK